MATTSLTGATSPLSLRQRLLLAAGVPCGSLLAAILAGGLYAVATPNYSNEPGIAAFYLLWWGVEATLRFAVALACCLRVAFIPWQRPAAAVAGGFTGLAVGLMVSGVGYWLVSRFAGSG